jgi:transcriptional regulator with XRE-family HTH domain
MRALRKVRGLTLKTLSQATGISLSYLSMIERNAANPSTDVLTGIANALGVDVSWFFMSRPGRGPLERQSVVRADARRNLNILYGTPSQEVGYSDMLLSGTIGGAFYMAICTFAPGSKSPNKPMISHEGEQHAVVIKGALELTLGDEVITLKEGDSYSFSTEINHSVQNALSEVETTIVWAVTQVVIPRDQEDKAQDKLDNP